MLSEDDLHANDSVDEARDIVNKTGRLPLPIVEERTFGKYADNFY